MTGPAVELLRNQLSSEPARLLAVSETEASVPFRPGGWTKKQVLGHLLDSCLNNHVRIVRALLEGGYAGPAYQQEGWVTVHRYDLLPWTELISLWLSHNKLLLHLVEQIDDGCAAMECSGGDEHCTLGGRLDDYASHMQHHLQQILP